MNITELVESSGWKKFMAKLYGMGAAVVIVGALFKIMHWPGASLMLIVGLSVEALIFFFSAFEPLHEELDWTLVYPELAGMTDPNEIDSFKSHEIKETGHSKPEKLVSNNNANIGAMSSFSNLPELDGETMSKIGDGLTKLSSTVSNLSDISDASIATKEYFQNVKIASDSVKELTDTYSSSNESLKESVGVLNTSYQNSANVMHKTGDAISDAYQRLANALVNEHENITRNSKNYEGSLESLNKNLSALNTVYELQLQSTNEHLKETNSLYKGLDEMTKNLKESVEETLHFKNEMGKLGNNIAALNDVYGNMLSAVNSAK